jgi:outer membrane lipoprotein-sorting protein
MWATVPTQARVEELNADQIIAKANHASLYQGEDFRGNVIMKITSKQGFVRERQFNMLRKDEGQGEGNQKYFVFFRKPADVRKMVFMVHKKTAVDAHDDRWLYMPSLDLVRRIAASDKRTSFVGSDFLYEDISGRNPAEDQHELTEVTDKAYVLKSKPKHPDDVEFSYYVTMVDKATFLPMQIAFFKGDDRLYRTIKAKQVELIPAQNDGDQKAYPTVIHSVAENLDTGSRTEMTLSNLRYNTGVETGIFSERYLRRPPREVTR